MNHITHINRKRELEKQLRLLVNYMPHYETLEELDKLNIEVLCIAQEIKDIERLPRAVQYSLTYFTRTTLTSKINEDRTKTKQRHGNDDCLAAQENLRIANISKYESECV